ncbi:MAG TPA: hybrid sensor histidine kinase/response regulator [Vicinamibacterales bacterium]|nr:hybrid sensor histidine kinase/response regulator [Vicinamibacterales bacterium]
MSSDRPHVLIVDDQARNLDALEVMLWPLDCDSVRALSADEALLTLLRHEFAAIVLDIRMPGMNGIELAKLIKQRKRSRDVPILFLTAHSVEEQDILQGYGVGAVDYLSKPVNAEILRSKVSVFLDLFNKTRALSRLNDALQAEVAERERVQAALRAANEDLERRVQERTNALLRAVAEARHARDEAERQSRLKDEFLASLSHELRTPMNVILGWLQTIEEGKPIRELHEALDIVRRNAELQAKLIDDLLDMNGLTFGNVRLELSRIDIREVLQATVQGLQPAANSKGIEVIASFDAELAPLIGDARRLQQVLWNLVHNAVKFTSRGGRVEVRVANTPDGIDIVVQDSGRGISPEFLPHIFDRFRQEEPSSAGGVSGLGLGLAIVKHLVELHGGSVHASSSGVGAGAAFRVLLPSASVQPGEHRIDVPSAGDTLSAST